MICDLCGLPVRGNSFERAYGGVLRRFCCSGCVNVYAILAVSGSLDHREDAVAYRVSSELGLIRGAEDFSPGLSTPGAPFSDVDREIEVPIRGMWCSSCAWLIERVLLKRKGVSRCAVQFVNDAARIRYCPRYISRQEIFEEIRRLGYEPGSPGGKAVDSVRRDLLVRLGVACAPGMYMMMFNIYLYEGYFIRLDPDVQRYLQQFLFFLALPIVTWCAWPIYRKAWGALRAGGTTMETLITLGAGSAFIYSVFATLTGRKQVYYDTASMIITLVLLGKYLEAVARARATSAFGSLNAMLPRKVRLRLPDGEERMVSADQVRVGDHAIVDAGSLVPLDGIVLDGSASIDESLLTGESAPVRRVVGDRVVGASLCVDGGIVIEALGLGESATVSRMAAVVRDAMAAKSHVEHMTDRISRVFVPAMIGVAACVLCWGLSVHLSLAAALMRAVSVLVVACPCALGIATPLAIAAAMGSAARRGILVRSSQTLEKACRIDTVVLDKTGTVTTGCLRVVDVLFPSFKRQDGRSGLPRGRILDGAEGSMACESAHWEAIASIEALSQHPAARAIVSWIKGRGYSIRSDVQIEILPGKGIRGRVAATSVYVGAVESAPALTGPMAVEVAEAEAKGYTAVAAACDRQTVCVFILADMPRPGAAEAVRDLKAAGLDVWLVSGDSGATTRSIAAQVGIRNVVSRALPEDKIRKVRLLKAEGKCVAMVGDGINDGPALAAADLGVAMGEGTQLAIEAADLALLSGDLRRLTYAFGLSSRTVRIIRQNLFWALAYNVCIIPAAIGLYGARLTIGPLFAAFAMLMSSLSVVFNSLRLQESVTAS